MLEFLFSLSVRFFHIFQILCLSSFLGKLDSVGPFRFWGFLFNKTTFGNIFQVWVSFLFLEFSTESLELNWISGLDPNTWIDLFEKFKLLVLRPVFLPLRYRDEYWSCPWSLFTHLNELQWLITCFDLFSYPLKLVLMARSILKFAHLGFTRVFLYVLFRKL